MCIRDSITPFIAFSLKERRRDLATFLAVQGIAATFQAYVYLLCPSAFTFQVGRGEVSEGFLVYISPYLPLMYKGLFPPFRIPSIAVWGVVTAVVLYKVLLNPVSKGVKVTAILALFGAVFMALYPFTYHHYDAWVLPLLLATACFDEHETFTPHAIAVLLASQCWIASDVLMAPIFTPEAKFYISLATGPLVALSHFFLAKEAYKLYTTQRRDLTPKKLNILVVPAFTSLLTLSVILWRFRLKPIFLSVGYYTRPIEEITALSFTAFPFLYVARRWLRR